MNKPIDHFIYYLATSLFFSVITPFSFAGSPRGLTTTPVDSIASVNELQELTVTAKRPDATVSADKISYSPATMLSGQSNLYEDLKAIPGITIDSKGSISLNGVQDVAVYIQEHNLLPEACIGASQGKETGRKIVQDYIAFWIGFYRRLPAYGNAPKSSLEEIQ